MTSRAPLSVSADVFDHLADGGGDVLGVLRAGQRSKRLLLLHEVTAAARTRARPTFIAAETPKALGLLAAARRRARHHVDELLLEPSIGAWAMSCLRHLGGGTVVPQDIGHLGGIAAAAALRADLDFEVAIYRHDSQVMLPGVGMLRLPGGDGWCRLRSTTRARGFEVDTDEGTLAVPRRAANDGRHGGPSWLPLRRLHSSAGDLAIDVGLDDIDPYRGCDQLQTTTRLTDVDVDEWQAKLDVAWQLLVENDRELAEAISGGISSLVPLEPAPTASDLSASCQAAIGAIALGPPRTPLGLVLALVHEHQHTKLWALMDLVPLLDASPGRFHYAPWRPDPRPLRGLLHGAYAFLGLTAFWLRHRDRQGCPAAGAGFELALGRSQLRVALRTLAADPRLYEPGVRFVEGMRRRLTALDESPVALRDRALARLARLDHAIAWRLRNAVPDPEAVELRAEAWRAGKACPRPGRPDVEVGDGGGPMPSDVRLVLIRQRAATLEGADGGCLETLDASPADLLLVEDDVNRAAETYAAQIESDPGDLASWAGLGLSRRLARTAASPALVARPETVRATYEAIRARTGAGPPVEELAAWMSAIPRTGRAACT